MEYRPDSRLSGLPRTSRLPQGRSALPEPSYATPHMANTSVVRPPRGGSRELPQPSGLRSPPPMTSTPAANKRRSMLAQPGFQVPGLRAPEPTGITSPTSTRLPGPPGSRTFSGLPTSPEAEPVSRFPRQGRASLSDRTAETLSRVPASPATGRTGRVRPQSAIYDVSPLKVQPPSRAESALDYNRPASRIATGVSGMRAPGRPTSPSKPTSRLGRTASVSQAGRTNTVTGRTNMSNVRPKVTTTGASTLRSPVKSPVKSGGKVASPTKPAGLGIARAQTFGTHARTGSKSHGRDTSVSKSSATSDEVTSPSSGKSSSALRDAIAQAKTAYHISGRQASATIPRAMTFDYSSYGPETDPMTLDLADSAHINILKKRIHNSQTDGKLNISALCLTEVPLEVLRMHETESSDIPWYETVDVTRLLAGDNEFQELPRELFPADLFVDGEVEDLHAMGPFPNLQHLDLHGNQLQILPETLANLMNLQTLVLEGNRLTPQGTWDVLCAMPSQKRLELGKNKLHGPIPSDITTLIQLELFDVHDNAITEIPTTIGNLPALKEVNVAGNRLESVPFEALFDLPLRNLNACRNRLTGSLFPKTVPMFEALVDLDVSHNALGFLAEAGVKLPKLRRLNISHNRIMELPDMSEWLSLEELIADENKISAFPEGFAKLKELTVANFSNNSLLQISRDIGFMDKLAKLDISYNPIRERILMKLNTDELKAELRSLHATEAAKEEKVISPQFGIGPRAQAGRAQAGPSSTPWTVSGGTVDRSNTRITSIDSQTVEAVAGQGVKSLILHHNSLQVFSPAIELLGASLTTLDLANNKLGKSQFLKAALCLPNLQSLNLTSNALTSLDPLTNLSADRLATLIVPFNRVTQLPALTKAFPSLKKLIVGNNKIAKLGVESVRGLEVLDISSNDLEALPPQLGLLQGQLRTLMVGANKFRVPGWGVLEKGTDEILKWCRNHLPAEEAAASAVNNATNELDKFSF